jgi:hypothetical protein
LGGYQTLVVCVCVCVFFFSGEISSPFLSMTKVVVNLYNARGLHDTTFRRKHITSRHCAKLQPLPCSWGLPNKIAMLSFLFRLVAPTCQWKRFEFFTFATHDL